MNWVSVAAAGPGFNLRIWTKYQDEPIKVDLVPVFEFKCTKLYEKMDIYRVLSQNGWVSNLSYVTSHKFYPKLTPSHLIILKT